MSRTKSRALLCAALLLLPAGCTDPEPPSPEAPEGLVTTPGSADAVSPTPGAGDGPPAAPEAPTTTSPAADGVAVGPVASTLRAQDFSRVWWVAPSGSDAAAGTEAAPFRSFARAISQLQPGEAVFAKSGTYAERLAITDRDGTASRWMTVAAAPGATVVLKGGTGSTRALLDVRRAYWRFEGLTLDVAGDKAFAALWREATGPHGLLRNCVAKNGTAGAGINIAHFASDVTVEHCDISHFQRVPLDDSHGVIVQTTTRNVVVRNSKIHHNSGDSVQCIGPEGGATVAGTPHDNLLVENNALHDNHENGVDVKTCTRVTLRGNSIWGHHNTASSRGEGIVVHMSARDVVIEDNVLRDNGRGISVGGNREGDPPTRITLRRNRIMDGAHADGDEGTAIRINTAWDVKVYHNTVYNMPTNCLGFGSGDSGNTDRIDVRNNVFAHCAVAVRAGALRSNVTVDANLYWRSGGSVQLVDGTAKSLSAWKSSTGWDASSVERDPGFVDLAARDLRLSSTSPAREAGVLLGLPYCGSAPDQGALESGCAGTAAVADIGAE